MFLEKIAKKYSTSSSDVMHPGLLAMCGMYVCKMAIRIVKDLGNVHLKSEPNIFTWVIILSLSAGGLSSLWILKPRLKMGAADKLFYFLHAGAYFALALYGVIVETCYR